MRRGSLAICFDPDLEWVVKANAECGLQAVYGDASAQTCVTMKVLFGMALRQTIGLVESLLRVIGLNWDVADVGTLRKIRPSVTFLIRRLQIAAQLVGSL